MLTCVWCEEPMTPRELPLAVLGDGIEGDVLWRHQACAVRQVVGSVAHQQRRCLCFGGPDDEDEGLTRRQAAEAALAYWRTEGGVA